MSLPISYASWSEQHLPIAVPGLPSMMLISPEAWSAQPSCMATSWRRGQELKDWRSRASRGRESGAHSHLAPDLMHPSSRAVVSVHRGEAGSASGTINPRCL